MNDNSKGTVERIDIGSNSLTHTVFECTIIFANKFRVNNSCNCEPYLSISISNSFRTELFSRF